jgi:succinate dehydrogenase flavin-adding protein (antitoxin of CptAB toxin-antitoxin module)
VPKLNIPEKYRQGVFKLSQLDDRTVKEIRTALGTLIAASGEPSKAAVNAVSAISATNKSDFIQIAESLVAMSYVKAGADVSLQEFVKDVSDAMENLEQAEFRVPAAQRERFSATLTTLLGADEFALASKVHDLQTDDERTFCRARILTDLRPVFGSKVEDAPQGFVITHLLKLGFHSASERQHDEFYIALDADDIKTLRGVLDRAEAKSKSLRAHLKDVRIFGLSKE